MSNAMAQGRMEWRDVKAQGDRQNTQRILNTLGEAQPTEKLDWPIFCGSRKNRKYKIDIYVLDTVRVKWPSSSHTRSREGHASWTQFSSTKPKTHSPAFEDSLCGFVYISVFPPLWEKEKQNNKTKHLFVMVQSSHNELYWLFHRL